MINEKINKNCIDVCPAITTSKKNKHIIHNAYAAYNLNAKIRENSSSGGIFYSLAEYFIINKGYVCGAVFDDNFNVKHIISNSLLDIEKMMGSKYVESEIKGVYREIKKLLDDNNNVLFTGCPCQVYALKCFLNKEYDNLLTIDFVCHGTPKRDVLKSYISLLERKYNSKIINFKFRDKKNGWHNSGLTCTFYNGKKYFNPINVDPYMKGFLHGITIKEGCFNCKIKNFTSKSDLTLADFWGAEVTQQEIDDNYGLSAVITHSLKAESILKKIRNKKIYVKEVDINDIIKYNQNIVTPTKKNEIYSDFHTMAKEKGYEYSIEKYLVESSFDKIKRLFINFLRNVYHKIKGDTPLY